MSHIITAHDRQEVLTELAFAVEQHTVVEAHVRPEGESSWVSHLTRAGRVVRVAYDPGEMDMWA